MTSTPDILEEKDDDAFEKLANLLKRAASASVGLAWQEHVSYHMSSLLASHNCSVVLILMNIANTEEVKKMVFAAVSLALRQYFDGQNPLTEPILDPSFKFIRKEVRVP